MIQKAQAKIMTKTKTNASNINYFSREVVQ